MTLLMTSLIGCTATKSLKKDQYQISNQGNSFIVKVTDTDINAENIETLKVKIKYKYAVIEHGGGIYDADFKTKTKTETFEVTKFDNVAGNFMGSFTTENAVSDFECKKVVAYYGENSKQNDAFISIPLAIGLAIVFFVIGVVIWFVLSALMVDVNVAFYIAVAPYMIGFFSMLVTGQWIPALIFFLGIGALLTLLRGVFQKLSD